jgi:hypothetical protein
MAALTKDRDTQRRDDVLYAHPVAAGACLYAGGMTALNATGYAVPAAASAALTVLGVAEGYADNSAGTDGDLKVSVKVRGAFKLASDGSIDRTHIGKAAYVVDDQTVSATNGGGTRPAAGTIRDVDASGVWVAF